MKTELEKFRTRWFRWLGQKCRSDRDSWVTLLNSNYSGWCNNILERLGWLPSITINSDKRDVYYKYWEAIAEATMKELRQLDEIYCRDVLLKGKI